MNRYFMAKKIMDKINVNEIIMAKPTMGKLTNNFKLIMGLLIMITFIRVK